MMRGTLLLLVGLASPLAAQGSGATELADARRGIDAGNAAYKAAYLKAAAAALAQVYDPAGARLQEDGAVVQGREAIAADAGKFMARVGPVRVGIETVQVWLLDGVAYETGTWTYTFQPKGKPEQRIGGRYLTLWKRQPDGSWKISSDLGVPGT
jgi:uncharacterized protein (TIGR02246 family)